MPTLNITNEQFRTSLQNIQNRYVRLELLNYKYQTVDELSGVCTSGTISINANSDIRRTASIVLTVTDTSFEVEPGARIWLDKYIRVYVGTQSLYTGEIQWINCGMYIIDAPNYAYNATTNTLTLSLLDMMTKLSGMRDGYLKGVPATIKAGENIRQVIIDTLALGGFTHYVVEEAPSPGTVPNDLEFDQGSTVYTLLAALRDIYPNYEMYFDVNGVFYYKPIPTGENDPIVMDNTLWDKIVISEQLAINFQNVKNVIEVYGRTHDPEHFSTETTVSGTYITLTMEDVSAYTDGMIYGFTLTDNEGIINPELRIGLLPRCPIYLSDGTTPAVIEAETGEVYYCVQYRAPESDDPLVNGIWIWLGHLQAYGYAEDNNEESPFYIGGTVGEIRLPLYGSDYENCFSDELAQQRAEYELYLHSQMNDTVTITAVPVYYLDVNILVEYTLQRNQIANQYLIKTIAMGLAPTDTMSLTLMRYYPSTDYYVDENTMLLLRGDNFEDASRYQRSVINHGVTISEEQHKIGSSSLAFNGESACLTIAPYDFGAGDFTIDWWEYRNNTNKGAVFEQDVAYWSGYGIVAGYMSANAATNVTLSISTDGSTWNVIDGLNMGTPTTEDWVHRAVVRSGTTIMTFENGVKIAEQTVAEDLALSYTTNWVVGAITSSTAPAYFNGYIDEFRISNVARWTEDFEPPTEPY